MGELGETAIRAGDAGIAKSHCLSQGVDLRLLTGEEVPACGGLGMAVALDVHRLLFRGELRALGGIDADSDDVEVLAGAELDHLERADEAIQLLRAEHGAGVIDDGENDRALGEVVAELDGGSGFVAEDLVERKLLVEALVDVDLAQDWRRLVGALAHLLVAVGGDLGKCGKRGGRDAAASKAAGKCLASKGLASARKASGRVGATLAPLPNRLDRCINISVFEPLYLC